MENSSRKSKSKSPGRTLSPPQFRSHALEMKEERLFSQRVSPSQKKRKAVKKKNMNEQFEGIIEAEVNKLTFACPGSVIDVQDKKKSMIP